MKEREQEYEELSMRKLAWQRVSKTEHIEQNEKMKKWLESSDQLMHTNESPPIPIDETCSEQHDEENMNELSWGWRVWYNAPTPNTAVAENP